MAKSNISRSIKGGNKRLNTGLADAVAPGGISIEYLVLSLHGK